MANEAASGTVRLNVVMQTRSRQDEVAWDAAQVLANDSFWRLSEHFCFQCDDLSSRKLIGVMLSIMNSKLVDNRTVSILYFA